MSIIPARFDSIPATAATPNNCSPGTRVRSWSSSNSRPDGVRRYQGPRRTPSDRLLASSEPPPHIRRMTQRDLFPAVRPAFADGYAYEPEFLSVGDEGAGRRARALAVGASEIQGLCGQQAHRQLRRPLRFL